MSKKFGVAYCGGIVKHDGYHFPQKGNLQTRDGSFIDTSRTDYDFTDIVNNTDADAFVYEYCEQDDSSCNIRISGETSNQSSVLYVLKSCASPKMPCTYTTASTRPKIITDNRYVWSKEIISDYQVNFDYGKSDISGRSKEDAYKLIGIDGLSIKSFTNTSAERNALKSARANVIKEYILNKYPSISVTITTNTTNISSCAVRLDNLTSNITVNFNSGTVDTELPLDQVLSAINSSTSSVSITGRSSTEDATTIARNRREALNEYFGLELPDSAISANTSASTSFCMITARKKVMADYNAFGRYNEHNPYRIGSYQTSAPYESYVNNVSSVTFSFINTPTTNDIPSATTENMFSGCTALTACNVPAQMRKISRNTFYECRNLTSYTVNPDFIEEVDENAFGNSGIKRAYIGIHTLIKPNSFNNCQNLREIVWHTTDEYGNFTQDASNWPRLQDYDYKIPDGAFSGCTSLTSTYFMRNGYCFLPDSGFGEEDSYDNILYIPRGFQTIGKQAFMNCSSLENVSLNGIERIEYEAFYNCENLQSVSGMSTVKFIGEDAFTNQNQVNIFGDLDSVEKIDSNAFLGRTVSGDSVLKLPNIIEIGANAFYEATIEGPVEITGTGVSGYSNIYSQSFASATIKGDVSIDGRCIIREESFSGASINGSVNISLDCTENNSPIHDNAFQEAMINGNLNITLYDNESSYLSYESFFGASISGNLTVNVDTIGEQAFSGSQISGNVEINANEINTQAFDGSSIGGNLTINAKTIGYEAFGNCNLTSVTIGSSVTSIGNYAFEWCSSLTSVTIGSSVTSIGDYAFNYCESLSSITSLASSAPTIDSSTFNRLPSSGTLYIPFGSTSSYEDTWKSQLGEGWTIVES